MSGGFYFCPHCHGPADLVDPGEPHPACVCGHRGLQWIKVEGSRCAAVAPAADPSPLDAAPMPARRRLPKEKRDLRVLARDGYWMCRTCEQITELDAIDRCVLCGSDAWLEWNAPVFSEEVAA